MKNKLVFRILGALASSLIIASVFIPFVSVTGYSQSLWETHEALGTLYLPIMIIVFGLIGVIFFSINIKTELAYTSSGALLFFLITQTIPIINQGTFNTLGVGYYCLVIGTIITGIMAFLCNLRKKRVVLENKSVEEVNDSSLINQIDKLYDNQIETNNFMDNNIIQSIPVENNINISEIQTVQPIIPIESVPMQNQTIQTEISPIQHQVEQPVIMENIPIPEINNNSSDNIIVSAEQDINSNIPVENFENTTIINPVVTEFNASQSANIINNAKGFNTPQQATVAQPIGYSNEHTTQFNQILNGDGIVQQHNQVVSDFSTQTMFTNQQPQMESENSFTSHNIQDKDNNLDIFN